MRVLGIDCGAERTGYGVIESDGRTHRMLSAGVIRTDPRASFGIRLKKIADGLSTIIEQYQPEAGAVEEVFFASNAKSALKLAQVRGVALLSLASAELEIGEYSPLEIKTSVVGYGRASKQQVQMMVRSLVHAEDGVALTSEDASDAVAVAVCHATRRAFAAVAGAPA